MKENNSICVVGLWHLGLVTSACLSSLDLNVTAYDSDKKTIQAIKKLNPLIDEPGLKELLKKGFENKKLKVTTSKKDLHNHQIYWVTYDTPVDDEDVADTNFVLEKIKELFEFFNNDSIVIISSQIPVGTTKKIIDLYEKSYDKKLNICYLPENLRLGNALNVFLNPDRIVVGCDKKEVRKKLEDLLLRITDNLIWTSIASAEMAKHTINAFLATSVAFANEISTLCEHVDADAKQVEKAIKSDKRIGKLAYLSPGGPFAGGTLARDINYLADLSKNKQIDLSLLLSVSHSNNNHKKWAINHLNEDFKSLSEVAVLILGIVYKRGTNTVRRSHSIELSNDLSKTCEEIYLYDPLVKSEDILNLGPNVYLLKSITELNKKFDCIILTREWDGILDELKELFNIHQTSSINIYDLHRKFYKNIEFFKSNKCFYKTVGLPSKNS